MLPQLDDALTVGSVFHWETAGLQITSTVQEVDPPRRIVWSGPAQGITAIHVWEFTPTDHGVLVHTEESWDGEVVRAQTATLQQALDGSLRAWLTNLKHAAEQAGR
jgi:Activator of Hsp90 ATPase homolog 1-like protein